MQPLDLVTSIVMPGISVLLIALLGLLGLLLTCIVSVWSALHVYAFFKGVSSDWVTFKVGRLFGELVYEDRYQKYKARRERFAQNARYRARYDRESGL